ncbi:hypothetical protein MMC30_001705 [Trapelia coarctata]|nr:hypothetical protein [Trapelia coarctata]
MPSLTEIAEEILTNAKRLDAYTSLKGLPSTSFEVDTLGGLPQDVEKARHALINSTQDLKRLALRPMNTLIEIMFSFADILALRAIYEYKLATHIPITTPISFGALAEKTPLSESLVRRFLRQAMTNHIFTESPPGHVAHNATSRLLAENPEAMDLVGLITDETVPASTKVIEALKRWPNSGEPTETAFNIEFNTPLATYSYLEQIPWRARRFGGGMRFFVRGEGWDLKYLLSGYDWGCLDHPGAVLVDVGGGQGAVAQVLAKATRNLKIIVQDLPETAQKGKEILPAELRGQVEFIGHDFFKEQPVRGADVYFFRWILHNWSDKYCLRILRALIPALTKGARVIAYEYVLLDGAETRLTEKHKS